MKKWNFIDKFIASFRYSIVKKYIVKDSVVADIGCGRECEFLLSHKDIIKKGYGFDFRIKDKVIDNIEFINNKNIAKLPLKKNSVDTVFMLAVLEHLDDPHTVLLDVFRVLKKGGNLVMTVPTPFAKPILEFLAFKLHIINEDEIREHKDYYDRKKIQKLVSELNKTIKVHLNVYKYFEFGVNGFIVITKE